MAAARDSLSEYNRKRDFRVTPEPAGRPGARCGTGRFVVQKHAASHLHYDFRLEFDGVLKSWAIPRGPSLDPAVKRMAVQVEDHPVAYGDFEGMIPRGQYGAGPVLLWDRGRWTPLGDAAKGLREGRLKFRLEGTKLKGGFMLVRTKPRGRGRQPSWLLVKEKDEHARAGPGFDVLTEMPESVKKPASRGGARQAGRVRCCAATAARAAACHAGGRAACPGQVAVRTEARWLPHAGARRWRRRAPVHAQWP